jgi:hypothetical protein
VISSLREVKLFCLPKVLLINLTPKDHCNTSVASTAHFAARGHYVMLLNKHQVVSIDATNFGVALQRLPVSTCHSIVFRALIHSRFVTRKAEAMHTEAEGMRGEAASDLQLPRCCQAATRDKHAHL